MDDIILIESSRKQVELMSRLSKSFALKDLGNLHYVLDIEVIRTKETLFMYQRKYIADLLQSNKDERLQVVHTPLCTGRWAV